MTLKHIQYMLLIWNLSIAQGTFTGIWNELAQIPCTPFQTLLHFFSLYVDQCKHLEVTRSQHSRYRICRILIWVSAGHIIKMIYTEVETGLQITFFFVVPNFICIYIYIIILAPSNCCYVLFKSCYFHKSSEFTWNLSCNQIIIK